MKLNQDNAPTGNVIRNLRDGHNVLLTGAGGTGKTWILKKIINTVDSRTAVTALTGVAALNLGGVTIHSFAGTGGHSSIGSLDAIHSNMRWRLTRRRIRGADFVFVDEVSMMRSDYLELVDAVFRKAMDERDKPFGGKPVLVSGDFLQLPPVVRDGETLTKPWAFQSPIWKQADFQIYNLEEVKRQDNLEFVAGLNEIRFGRCPQHVDDMLRSRVNAPLNTMLKPIRFMPTNQQVDRINQANLQDLDGEPKVYRAEVSGKTDDLKAQVTRDCLAPETLALKVGAQVMVLKNDTECSQYINGSMGNVVGFNDGGMPIVRIERSGEEVEFSPHSWERRTEQDDVLARFRQIPLKLAYGMTIHKSQGLTLDYSEIDLRGSFAPGQVYVALSRVRSLEGLRLLNWDKDLVKADRAAVAFYENGCRWENIPETPITAPPQSAAADKKVKLSWNALSKMIRQ